MLSEQDIADRVRVKFLANTAYTERVAARAIEATLSYCTRMSVSPRRESRSRMRTHAARIYAQARNPVEHEVRSQYSGVISALLLLWQIWRALQLLKAIIWFILEVFRDDET